MRVLEAGGCGVGGGFADGRCQVVGSWQAEAGRLNLCVEFAGYLARNHLLGFFWPPRREIFAERMVSNM